MWVGPGSSSILASIALAMGGPATTAVYSDQSFVRDTIITAIAHSTAVTVPLDPEMRLDAPGHAAAADPDTTVLYVCNPNTPTGTYLRPEAVEEIIESVPLFLARASQEARQRQMVRTVQPVLDHAEQYFLRPVDLIPEMTMGLAGLLDDTYLVLRILENLDRGSEPFLDWDLEFPLAFLRGLVGREIGSKLDTISLTAMEEVSSQLNLVWEQVSHDA